MTPRPRPTRGAALLVAMVLLSVVATLAAGMVWQQWKAVQVETAERARVQTVWILNGALDWARLILREDARSGHPTSLDEPWATPLAEARLSTFLAADQNNNAEDNGPEAFLSGNIADAQARYNLRNLLTDGKVDPRQLGVLQRLCTSVGLPTDVAGRLANGLLASAGGSEADAPLAPQQMDDLVWLGLDAATVARLSTVTVLLPVPTPINLNTAPREVLAAVIEGIDLGGADRLVQARSRKPLKIVQEARDLLGQGVVIGERDGDVKSAYFEVHGRLRLEQRLMDTISLVERRGGLDVVAIQRRRVAGVLAPNR